MGFCAIAGDEKAIELFIANRLHIQRDPTLLNSSNKHQQK
jgi:hypothetical protein